ncbi:hypothetical protein EV702DRAFT_1045540 [Suillus placidus]|uniref:Uncharacterized protein n=1 Tax=Suillus placidus TaxID=48579 RepID=A0A9P6ZVD3_9AGAM|nr:hypothetical protein EV702DRAFT_1045540 [Suillus placidus]
MTESDNEGLKQPPLNAEELAVLEGYLEQWTSTSGQESNVVWGDNHGEKKDPKPPIKLSRKWTYRMVVESLRKRELLKKIKDETGANPGEPEMMHHYAKYLMEMVNSLTKKEVKEAAQMAAKWNQQGIPTEVQADMARQKSKDILLYVAQEMFKKAGMRLFMMSAWKNEEGKLMVSRQYSWNGRDMLPNSSVSMFRVFLGVTDQWHEEIEFTDELVVKKGRKDNMYTLEIGADGLPVLLDHAEIGVLELALFGRTKDPVPWKEVIPRQDELIPPPYLSEGRKIREPSRMNRDEATKLLDFWYNRQESCQNVVFKFYRWWSKADKEVKLPVRQPTKKTAQKHSVSKPRISLEESADEFRVPDSSEESLDDKFPVATNGNASVKYTGHKANASDMVQEPSASRAPPTPMDNPRRVGPTYHPGGVVRCKRGGAKVTAPSSPKKLTKTQTQCKKHPAEEQLDESPTKCTKV